MPGPKYHYLNIRDDLRVGETGRGQISIRDIGLNISSSADGTLNINADTIAKITAPTTELESSTGITLDGDVTIDGSHTFTSAGDMSLTGDLTRRYAKYISANALWTIASGYTRCPWWTEIIDDGTVILSGKSGNIYPKLPSPSIGKMVTFVYIHSGVTAGFTAKLSANSIRTGTKTAHAENYYATFQQVGQSCTFVNDGTSYYLSHPSGASMPILSTT